MDRGNDNALYRNFFDNLKNNGALYDVIGMSYYPYWLGQDYTPSIGNLTNNLKDMVARYGKEVIVAEVGGDYTAVQNTYDMLVAVQNAVRSVPNAKGLGVFYWEPEGAKSWSGYQLSAWDDNGRPTKALDAFLVSSAPSVIANPGFEANAAATQTPSGWTTWSNITGSAAADYTENNAHSGTYRLTHWLNTTYQVSTYQILTGLTNGSYTLKAWVKSSGGQTACQLYAKQFGGAERNSPLPVGDSWTQIQITGIQVTNGQCEIGLYSVANAGNWCSLDDIEFYKEPTTGARLVAEKAEDTLQVRILSNPVSGDHAEIEIRGAENQPVQLVLVTAAGLPVLTRHIREAASTERYALGLAKAMGVYLLRVSTPQKVVVLKVVKQ